MLVNPIQRKETIILVVDDDPTTRLLIQTALAQNDYQFHETDNGTDALKICKRVKPDLVLMDVNMPGMNGFETCQEMRRLASGREFSIVLITGQEDTASVEKAFACEATDFIGKPVNWILFPYRIRNLVKANKTMVSLRTNELLLSEAQKIAKIGAWRWDALADQMELSEELYHIMEYTQSNSTNQPQFHIESLPKTQQVLIRDTIAKAIESGERIHVHQGFRSKSGQLKSLQIDAIAQFDTQNNQLIGVHGIIQDITERMAVEQKIHKLAYYDRLTSLPNLELFKEHAYHAIEYARRDHRKFALVYLDLDDLKLINNSFGRDEGDEVIKKVASLLRAEIRTSDIVAKASISEPLSRIDGDKFTFLLTRLRSKDEAALVCNRVLNKLRLSSNISDRGYRVTGSIGISMFPDDGDNLETLLKHAEIAQHQAKTQGKNTFQFFDNKINQQIHQKLELETQLKQAIENNELLLHYQPKVEANSHKIVGLEALVRWQHPTKGMIPPGKFIALAEESSLIDDIGAWVLKNACQQMAEWCAAGTTNIVISVNLSPHQLKRQDIVALVKETLKETQVESKFLELELTESALMDDIEKSIAILEQLKQMGIKLSIDDFGTGYSSMMYLKSLPVDTLKIDRSFVSDASTNASDGAIVKAIISLAQALQLSTVAEGVETADQLNYLERSGCDQIQGFYFSKPLPAHEISQLLYQNKPLVGETQKPFKPQKKPDLISG